MTAANWQPKRMRLRYSGVCRSCGAAAAARVEAIYHPLLKQVECLHCADSADITVPAPEPEDAVASTPEIEPAEGLDVAVAAELDEPADEIDAGVAGSSARREHERRVAKREDRIRSAHRRLGKLILAVTGDPQSTTAWARGAAGEEKLAKRLDDLREQGVLMLHDRRIPNSKANIDHIAVSSAGVFVIDAKRYKARPHLRVRGGLFSPRVESLIVGTCDQTKLVNGLLKQVGLVRAALTETHNDVPVRGMLCFIDADWPLAGGSFTTRGVDVLWPKKASRHLTAEGPLSAASALAIHRALAEHYPIA
jgi:hypothetical protein